MKFDLSKFKKVSSDKNSTILLHPDGHQFKIAHSKLQPKLKDQLDKLPIHKAKGGMVKYYADGSDEPVGEDASSKMPQGAPPINININGQPNASQMPPAWSPDQIQNNQPANAQGAVVSPQQAQNQGVAQLPQQTMAQTQQSAADQSNTPQTMSAMEPSDQDEQTEEDNSPEQASQEKPQAPQVPKGVLQSPEEIKNDLTQETQALQQDFSNGHIQPHTYADLYGKKDTLGKIGTIFGLLVSGAGSGLTHQPNALLQMMNNELNNDWEAQKQSNANAQNFYRLSQQQHLNQAQIKKMVQEGTLTEAQAKLAGVEAEAKSFALGRIRTIQSTFNDLVNAVKKAPEGPQKQAAIQNLGLVYSKWGDQVVGAVNQAAGASALLNMVPSTGEDKSSNGPVNYNKFNQLERASQMKVPGAPSESDIGSMTKEAATLESARSLRNDFNQAFDALDKKFLAGKLSPHDRDSYVNSLAGKLAKASAGRYNEAEARAQVNSMIPQSGDWDTTKQDKRKNDDAFFNMLESETPTLNRFNAKNPPQQTLSNQNQGSGQTIQRRDPKSGRMAVYDSNTKKFLNWK